MWCRIKVLSPAIKKIFKMWHSKAIKIVKAALYANLKSKYILCRIKNKCYMQPGEFDNSTG